MPATTTLPAPPATAKEDPAWLRAALSGYQPNWRGPVSVRRADPTSPESIWLAEQAAARAGRTLRDSRVLAERLAEAAARGVEEEG